jgi:hypothetical protein
VTVTGKSVHRHACGETKEKLPHKKKTWATNTELPLEMTYYATDYENGNRYEENIVCPNDLQLQSFYIKHRQRLFQSNGILKKKKKKVEC